jgi:hypothetical protein
MKNLNKTFLLLLGFCLTFSVCFAQTGNKQDYQKFARWFPSKIPLPGELMRNCTPTVCLIKINVDSDKHIINMQMSDSADSLLVKEFNLHKIDLDLKPLEKYLKDSYANDSSNIFLIPLSYAMTSRACGTQSINISTLILYNSFDGKNINGNVVFLDPIYVRNDSQR